MTEWDFEQGETVYLKTDEEQLKRTVVERTEKYGGSKMYGLTFGVEFSFHYDIEITKDYDPLKELGITESKAN